MRKVLDNGDIHYLSAPIPQHIDGYYVDAHNSNIFHPISTKCSLRSRVLETKPCGKIYTRFLCSDRHKAIVIAECVQCVKRDDGEESVLDWLNVEKIDKILGR